MFVAENITFYVQLSLTNVVLIIRVSVINTS